MFSEIKKYLVFLSVAFSQSFYCSNYCSCIISKRSFCKSYLVGFPNALVEELLLNSNFDTFQKIFKIVGLVIHFYWGLGSNTILSLITDSFSLLLGSFTLGVGQSATLQSRYAASFVASETYKATSLSLAVWFSVFGSIFNRLVGEYSELFQKHLTLNLLLVIYSTAGMILLVFLFIFFLKDTTLREPQIRTN